MSAREVGAEPTLKRMEIALKSKYEKLIDLSDSWYILIAPTSANFSFLSRIISSDLRMIVSAVLIDDGFAGEGFEEFKEKLISLNGREKVIEEIIGKVDQVRMIAHFSELSELMKNYEGELGLKALVVCSGPYKIDLFHLSLYLDARAIELTDDSYRELVAYPTWKLNEVSLSILYVAMLLEEVGERVTPHNLAKYVKLREKGGDARSKVVSLDYHVRKYLEAEGLLQKERDPESKRGIAYKLTQKGLNVAKLTEAHFRSLRKRIEDYVELEALRQFVKIEVE
ncbi:MAG: hypothetical protein NZ992_01455 [Candidatus Korarchaeum sp.]|nr:hypothetical protein [Candidatus Korarchaeum sp.]MDW8035240.1 hypothetical protein [Candidatus Korarchaeum sp.]